LSGCPSVTDSEVNKYDSDSMKFKLIIQSPSDKPPI
jgi:hypothetical protein